LLGSVVTSSSAGLLSSVMESDSDEDEDSDCGHEDSESDSNGDLPDTGGANRNLLILGLLFFAVGGSVVLLAGRRAKLESGDDII
jgi:LPXTG-motif cell wall-anchored protein